jgi:hypothetical protein
VTGVARRAATGAIDVARMSRRETDLHMGGERPGAGCPASRCDLAVLPRLVYVMHEASAMWRHAISATRLLGALGMSALLACASDGSRPPRTDGSCFIGGCNSEVCSDRSEVFSPCIWRDAYACFGDATCARQTDGACGWTPTPELEACLAAHDPLPGDHSPRRDPGLR